MNTIIQAMLRYCVLFGAGSLPVTGVLASCVNPPLGIVSWWQAESDASDYFGGNYGTLSGSVTFIPGKIGTAFDYDGNGDAVVAGTGTNLHLQDFSIEAWVRPSDSQPSLDGNGNGTLFVPLSTNGVQISASLPATNRSQFFRLYQP